VTELATAIAKANLWTATGQPIVKATFALDDTAWDVRHNTDIRTGSEASGYIHKARNMLLEMLDGIRDEFLCDERRSCFSEMQESEIADVDAWNDELDESVVSVEALIKQMEDEA